VCCWQKPARLHNDATPTENIHFEKVEF